MEPLELVKSEGPQVEGQAKNVAVQPPTKEELMHEVNALGTQLRELIVKAKRLPRDKSLEPH